MSSPVSTPTPARHPTGTLAILAVYGAAFAVGWLVLYLLVYAPRGAILP